MKKTIFILMISFLFNCSTNPSENLPDLKIVKIYADQSDTLPRLYRLKVDYTNAGNTGSTKGFMIRISTAKGVYDGNTNYPFTVPNPGDTESTGFYMSWLFGFNQIDSGIVTATIDWQDSIKESDETNNVISKYLIFGKPSGK